MSNRETLYILTGYVEYRRDKADARLDNEPRFKYRYYRAICNARKALQGSIFSGAPVVSVSASDDCDAKTPAHIRHFAYNNNCVGGCGHKDEEYGVWRLFGFELVVRTGLTIALIGETYEIAPGVRFVVCSSGPSCDVAFKQKARTPMAMY